MHTIIFKLIIVFLTIVLISTYEFVNESLNLKWSMPSDTKTFNDIKYILYTRNSKPELFNESTGFKGFQQKKLTKVLIHGYKENPVKSFWISLLRETFLEVVDCNVILVDWSKYALEQNYVVACKNTQPIGQTIGLFLLKLGINLSTTELAGFSLGCHVAGNVGSSTGSKVQRIIAFDPALPGFSSHTKYRLDSSDAFIVEVIHTCAKILGFSEPIGLRDFYANGGVHPQPGCRQVSPACSHRRSPLYYNEALLSHGRAFKTRRCNSYSDYIENKCEEQPFLDLANHNVNTNLNGNFYFTTNSGSPFGKYSRCLKKNGYS